MFKDYLEYNCHIIGQSFKNKRLQLGFSKYLISMLLGITACKLDDIENGKFEIYPSELLRLSELYHTKLNDFFDEKRLICIC